MTQEFADSSGKGHVLISNGASVTSDKSVFGNASYYFDGSSYISIPDSDSFSFGTYNFTIDMWINPSSLGSEQYIIGQRDSLSSVFWFIRLESSSNKIRIYAKNTSVVCDYEEITASITTTDVWSHIAVTREGEVLKLWVNGISSALTENVAILTKSWCDSSDVFRVGVGEGGSSGFFSGYMDELRIIKNGALWTKNFLPPNAIQYGLTNYDKLIIHGDAIKDVSRSVNTVSATGVTISTTESKFGDSSLLFNGTNGYLSIPDSEDFNFESEDFTIDLWIRFDSIKSGFNTIIGQTENGSYVLKWGLHYESSHNLTVNFHNPSSTPYNLQWSWTPSLDTWYHIAVSRSGSTWYAFINGVSQGTKTESTALPNCTHEVRIGHMEGFSEYFDGYMSEIRVSKGIARWTENFIPPIETYPQYDIPIATTVDDETVLLIHADGTNTSTNFKDYGVTNHTITANGTAQISTSQYKFGGSSLLLDGNSDYLSIPDSEDWNFTSSRYTIDCWVYSNNLSNTNTIVSQRTNANPSWTLYIASDGAVKTWSYNGSSSATFESGTGLVTENTWNHIALVLTDSNVFIFLNGQQVASGVIGSDFYPSNCSSVLMIGRNEESGKERYFSGYIDELRMSKGIARWINNFTPPTRAHPMAKDSSTKLLIHGENITTKNGISSNNYFKDSSESDHDIFPIGDVTLSSAQSKFDNRSILFNGSSDYLTIADSDDWPASTNDFTIDCWCRFSDISSDKGIWQQFDSDSDRTGLNWSSGGFLQFVSKESGSTIVSTQATWTPTIDTWYHIAVVRYGSAFKIYIDGTDATTSGGTDSSPLPNLEGNFMIGLHRTSAYGYFNGYIDEFRVSNGIARWTENFTPSTIPYKNNM